MKTIKNFIYLISVIIGVVSCSDYLDTYPKDTLTIDEVFQNKNYTEQYLANVYNYTRTDNKWSNDAPWTGLSDELDVTYPDYSISNMNLGALTPDKGWYDNWTALYKGVRSATYFINRIDENPEITEDVKAKYKEEARFLRIWHYFNIFRQYGPIVILSDELVAPDASIDEMTFPRSPVSECMDYMIQELDIAINSGNLPQTVAANPSADMGRVTVGACKALKSRLLLYAASDLYNNDRNGSFYDDFKNNDGTLLLDYTDAGRTDRWQKAADAAKEVIDMGFSLYKEYVENSSDIDPYKSYKNLFIVDWNDEVIWAKPAGNFYEMNMAGNPRVVGAWNGWGPTQKMVDAYYTKNGLPIADDPDFPIQKDPIYTEEGYTATTGDDGYTQPNTFRMYTNREPRFYVSIMFNNAKTNLSDLGSNQKTVEFFYGGNSGLTPTATRNYSQTGYLASKFVHPDANPSTGKEAEHARIFFRLGEIYLNYIEALNEIDYETNKTEIIKYLNEIRKRAGIPGVGEDDVPVPANQDAMRQVIRRERQIELAFETHRYFDCMRWLTADKEFHGDMYGMDITQSNRDEFHRRVVFESRVFEKKNILYPLKLSELFKGRELVQNPGW